jgi:hypothetical protein
MTAVEEIPEMSDNGQAVSMKRHQLGKPER